MGYDIIVYSFRFIATLASQFRSSEDGHKQRPEVVRLNWTVHRLCSGTYLYASDL